MNIQRLEEVWTAAALLVLLGLAACGGAAPSAPASLAQQPEIIEWSIGPKGGLGEGNALITRASWEPKKLLVPVNQPFIIRFVPRDDSTDTVIFSNGLKEEVGIALQDLVVENGQPADTPVMIIGSGNKAFDVFSREHRGVGGFGSVVTPPT
jgi:hypothetical protein